MKKIFTKLIGVTLGLAMAVGVGVGVAANNRKATTLDAAEQTVTIVYSAQGYGNAAEVPSTTSGVITTTHADGSNTAKYYNTGSGLRIYNGGSYTVSTSTGTLVSATLTFSSNGYMFADNNVAPSCTGCTWSQDTDSNIAVMTANSSVTSMSAAVSKTCRLQRVVVVYEDGQGGETLAKPVPSFTGNSVTWSDVAHASSYDISINGGEPIHNATSPYSTSGFAVPGAYTVSVKAIGNGSTYLDSPEGSVTFALLNKAGTEAEPYDVANARAAIDGNQGLTGVYATGIVSEIVTAYDPTYHNISYNISADGSTESEQLQAFRGKSYGGANFTSADDIQVGATVVVYGNLTKFNSTYEFEADNQLISHSVPGVLDTPQPHYSDGQITWEAIENATSYDVSVDGGETIHNATSPYALGVLSSPASHRVTVTAIGGGLYSDSNPGLVIFALLTKAGTAGDPYDIPNAKAAIDADTGVSDVYVAGKISEVGSYEDNTITYWISDDGTTTNQFEVYKGKGLNGANFSSVDDIETGASVVVKGNIKLYNETYEFNSNSQLYSYSAPVKPVDYYLDRANSFKTLSAHENCTAGNEESASETVNDLADDNSWTTSVQNSEVCYTSFSLDSNITISTTGDANCGSVWESSGTKDWRLYQNKGGDIVVTAAAGYRLTSITFTFGTSKSGILLLGEDEVTSGTAVTVSGRSQTFTVGNSTSATNGQVRITGFEVAYQEYTFDSVDSVALRFGAEFEKDDWDALASNYTIKDYGVMLFKRLPDSAQPTLTVEDAYFGGKTLASVRKGSGEAPYLDLESNKYIFNAKVAISSSNYNLVIVAAPFIVIDDGTEDGDYRFLDQVECSAKTLAQYHITNGGSELSADALAVIAA